MNTKTLQGFKRCFDQNAEFGKLQLNTLTFPFKEARTGVIDHIKMNETASEVIGQIIELKRLKIAVG